MEHRWRFSAFVMAVFLVVGLAEGQGGTLSSDNGRYVFGQISEFRRDQYLLDTETGRLWVLVVKEDSSYILQPIPYWHVGLWAESFLPESKDELELWEEFIREKGSLDHIKHKKRSARELLDSLREIETKEQGKETEKKKERNHQNNKSENGGE